jgi:Domain of unknown function (DUF4411)
MSFFWIDSSVLIQAHRGPYAHDIAPCFWHGLEKHISDGTIRSPNEVFDELSPGDWLADWASGIKENFFVISEEPIQRAFTPIADHVIKTYPPQWVAKFLAKADPWVIAHAQEDKGIIVTLETRSEPSHVKIPVVGDYFGLRSISTYDLMRELKIFLS